MTTLAEKLIAQCDVVEKHHVRQLLDNQQIPADYRQAVQEVLDLVGECIDDIKDTDKYVLEADAEVEGMREQLRKYTAKLEEYKKRESKPDPKEKHPATGKMLTILFSVEDGHRAMEAFNLFQSANGVTPIRMCAFDALTYPLKTIEDMAAIEKNNYEPEWLEEYINEARHWMKTRCEVKA
jgi:hypothetical protein